MIKKIVLGALISSVTLMALPNNELQLVALSKAIEKKAVVLSNMKLQGEAKENFGKLYDEYQGKLLKMRHNELQLINNYAANYNHMTNETADKVIIRWMNVEEEEIALKKEYILKFRKILPSADVIRYFQIENRFQLMLETKAAGLIPLAKPSYPSADMSIRTKDAKVKTEAAVKTAPATETKPVTESNTSK